MERHGSGFFVKIKSSPELEKDISPDIVLASRPAEFTLTDPAFLIFFKKKDRLVSQLLQAATAETVLKPAFDPFPESFIQH